MKKIEEIVLHEVNFPTLETTKFFFRNYDIERKDSFPIIERISNNDTNKFVIAYLRVSKYNLYLAIYLDKKKSFEVVESIIEPGSRVYLNISSYSMTLREMTKVSGLNPSSGWSLGDVSVKRSYKHTSFMIENTQMLLSEDIGKKIEDLLSRLILQKSSLMILSEHGNFRLSIIMWVHKSNIEGLLLRSDTIKKINLLDFDFDLDIQYYVTG